jgi:hypothetical protein
MAKRSVKRTAKAKTRVRRLSRKLDFRTIANPAGWYIDGHGDAGPYHDQHDDGGTYYDHPDSSHNDFHWDQTGIQRVFQGDPAELVTQSIDNLQRVMAKFEADFGQRIVKLEARLAAVEAWSKRRR